MNIFKGLLFLHGHLTTDEFVDDDKHYGAATAAREFAPELGNRAASAKWFGLRSAPSDASRIDKVAPAGGCR